MPLRHNNAIIDFYADTFTLTPRHDKNSHVALIISPSADDIAAAATDAAPDSWRTHDAATMPLKHLLITPAAMPLRHDTMRRCQSFAACMILRRLMRHATRRRRAPRRRDAIITDIERYLMPFTCLMFSLLDIYFMILMPLDTPTLHAIY